MGVEHTKVMEELQKEWEQNESKHKAQRHNARGIVSSQISALVALLVKKDVLKPKED